MTGRQSTLPRCLAGDCRAQPLLRMSGGGDVHYPAIPPALPLPLILSSRWACRTGVIEGAREMLEIPRLAEVLVDRGEADVGDRVERLQALHHHLADPARRHLALAAGLELALDRGCEPLDPLRRNRPLAAGDRDRTLELAAVERLAPVLRLDDGELAQLHPLEGGEARPAILALPPPPDRRAVLGGTAVLHLAVLMAAERAAHSGFLGKAPQDGDARADDRPDADRDERNRHGSNGADRGAGSDLLARLALQDRFGRLADLLGGAGGESDQHLADAFALSLGPHRRAAGRAKVRIVS